MADVHIQLNGRGMAELLKSDDIRRMLEKKAEKVLDEAQADAPFVTGDYRESLHVETVEHPSRVVARVAAGVDYAMEVEANHGTLSRALDAAGGV